MAEGGMNQGGEEVGMWLMRRHFSLACTMLDRPSRPPGSVLMAADVHAWRHVAHH